MKWSEQTDKITPALVKVQQALGPVKKAGKNPHFKSVYATLDDVLETVLPALNENGLVLVQGPDVAGPVDTQPVVDVLVSTIRHTSGQYVECFLRLNPVKNDPQGLGSAITYARRYSLCAMLGLMQEDDDGNAATHRQASKPVQKAAPKQQAKPTPKAVTIDEDTPILYESDNKDRMPASKMSDKALVEVHEWYSRRALTTQKQPVKEQLEAVRDMLATCAEARGVDLIPF